MKCVKCGAEWKEGCLYCSVCGYEAQVGSDYSILEDEYLRSILKEESQEHTIIEKQRKTVPPTPKRKKKKSSKIPIFVVCCILSVCLLSVIIWKSYINYKNDNSYDYQVEMAKYEETDKNYETALKYYKTALTLRPSDIPVRLAMTKIYIGKKEYDTALVLCMEVIGLDKKNQSAYKNLIKIYEEQEDYESIAALASDLKDPDILELFRGYIVSAPVISPIGGVYDDYMAVTLFSIEAFDIYYTLDGTIPNSDDGILYKEGEEIRLEEAGEHEVKAICYNEKGICGPVAEELFIIDLVSPGYPSVTPDGGRIMEKTSVTITADDNCDIYYTWDGTEPTAESATYEAPLEIPPGNTILSVLAIDRKTGLDSGVYRTNFIYYP